MPILKWQHVILIGTLLVFLLGSTADGSEAGNPGVKLKGPYLGMKPPGKVPELFAPGIVSTLFHEHSFLSFSPDGSEIYWTTII